MQITVYRAIAHFQQDQLRLVECGEKLFTDRPSTVQTWLDLCGYVPRREQGLWTAL